MPLNFGKSACCEASVYIYICIFYFYDYTEDGRVSKANFFLQMLHIKINGQQPFLL